MPTFGNAENTTSADFDEFDFNRARIFRSEMARHEVLGRWCLNRFSTILMVSSS